MCSARQLRRYPRRGDKCANNPQWASEPLEQKRTLVCWACLPLVDKSLRPRSKPCANPRPWTKDARTTNLYSFTGYTLEMKTRGAGGAGQVDRTTEASHQLHHDDRPRPTSLPPAPRDDEAIAAAALQGEEGLPGEAPPELLAATIADDGEWKRENGQAEVSSQPSASPTMIARNDSDGEEQAEESSAGHQPTTATNVDGLAQTLAQAFCPSDGATNPTLTAQFWHELQGKVEALLGRARTAPLDSPHLDFPDADLSQEWTEEEQSRSPPPGLVPVTPPGEMEWAQVEEQEKEKEKENEKEKEKEKKERRQHHTQPQRAGFRGPTSEEGKAKKGDPSGGHPLRTDRQPEQLHHTERNGTYGGRSSQKRANGGCDRNETHAGRPWEPRPFADRPPGTYRDHETRHDRRTTRKRRQRDGMRHNGGAYVSPPLPKRHRASPDQLHRPRSSATTSASEGRGRPRQPPSDRSVDRRPRWQGRDGRGERRDDEPRAQGQRWQHEQRHDQQAVRKERDACPDEVRQQDDDEGLGEKKTTDASQGLEVMCWSATTGVFSGGEKAQQDGEEEEDEEEEVWRWLEDERQERARLRATSDRHLADGEQPSQAASAAKGSTQERLTLAWHTLPTPFVFELADVPYPTLARASGAEVSALLEKNLKARRAQLQRAQLRRRQGNGGAGADLGCEAGPGGRSEDDSLLKEANTLLDWCRHELFPFLEEVDRIHSQQVDAKVRATFLYLHLLSPLRDLIQRRRPNPTKRA